MPEKIRVLIVDDFAETRENIRKMLQFESDLEVCGAARTGKEAVTLAKETQPHVVIMDINMPDMDGIKATEGVLKEVAFAQVVILSVQSDSEYIKRAMLVGARYFLSKPPSIDELISTVRALGQRAQQIEQQIRLRVDEKPGPESAARWQPAQRKGKIIAVYGPKGGVGRTTVAVNLACTLHTADTPTLLVDGAVQYGDVAVFLNLQAKNSLADLTDKASELDAELLETVLVSYASGLKVLTAPPTPEQSETVQAAQMKKLLRLLATVFQYVIVDTPTALNDVTLEILDASDLIILLGAPDIPTIKNVRLYYDIAEGLIDDGGAKYSSKSMLVMNRMDKRFGITAEAVSENLKQPVVAQLPLDEATAIQATNKGVPFMMGDRTRPVARGIVELSQTLRSRLSDGKGVPVEEEKEKERKPVRTGILRPR